jgi:hypothetical protein
LRFGGGAPSLIPTASRASSAATSSHITRGVPVWRSR